MTTTQRTITAAFILQSSALLAVMMGWDLGSTLVLGSGAALSMFLVPTDGEFSHDPRARDDDGE